MVLSVRSTLAGAVVVAATLLAGPATAEPAPSSPGSLDPGFGHDGRAYADFGRTRPEQMAEAVAVQTSGRVTAAGTLLTDRSSQFDVTRWAVARWHADGRPDQGFGTHGRVVTSIHSDDVADSARTVAVHDHGKVLVGGSADGRFALIAYTRHGRLDSTWGDDGIVTTEIPSGVGSVLDLRVLGDGSVLAAGNAGDRLAIARYAADGTLDPSYGAGGIVTSAQPFGGDVFGVQLQPGGGLVATGQSEQDGESLVGVRTVEIDAAGLPDPDFGTAGVVTTVPRTAVASVGRAVVVQPDGRVVVAGSAFGRGGNLRYLVLRYRTDGSLDPAFGGGDGSAELLLGHEAEAEDVVLQPDGRIVTTGWAGRHPRRVVVARFTRAGRPDHSFNGTGYRRIGLGAGSYAEGRALALANGRVQVVGGLQHPSGTAGSRFAAVRLRG